MIDYQLDGKTVQLPDELWECIKSLDTWVLTDVLRAYTKPYTPETRMYKYERMDGVWVIPKALYDELGPLNWYTYSRTVMTLWVREHQAPTPAPVVPTPALYALPALLDPESIPVRRELRPLTEVLK